MSPDAGEEPAGPDATWLIVGLGNPGPRYAANRHNLGAMVAERLAPLLGGRLSHQARHRASVVEGRLAVVDGGRPGPRAVVAVPSTYMNECGGAVAGLARYHRVEPATTVVVHDELDLPFATIRLKRGGGEGGHNGLRSISTSLGTRDYLRVRLGIGRPPGRTEAADFVLSDFRAAERPDLPFLLADAEDAVRDLVLLGLTATQRRVHAP